MRNVFILFCTTPERSIPNVYLHSPKSCIVVTTFLYLTLLLIKPNFSFSITNQISRVLSYTKIYICISAFIGLMPFTYSAFLFFPVKWISSKSHISSHYTRSVLFLLTQLTCRSFYGFLVLLQLIFPLIYTSSANFSSFMSILKILLTDQHWSLWHSD